MLALLRLSRLLDALSEWSGRGVSWLTLVLVLVGAYNTLARWGGRHIGIDLSSNGLIETQWYLFTLLFLLAASYTLKHNAHVRVDVLYGRLGKRARAVIDLVGTLLLLLPFCLFAIVFTWHGVIDSWQVREVSPDPGGLPRYPLKAVVPVAFVLVMLQGLSEFIKRLLFLSGRLAPAEDAKQPGDRI